MYCSRDMVLGVLSLPEEFRFPGPIVSEVAPEFQNVHELRMDVLLFERWRETHAGVEARPGTGRPPPDTRVGLSRLVGRCRNT
jgi:hypothetical protein